MIDIALLMIATVVAVGAFVVILIAVAVLAAGVRGVIETVRWARRGIRHRGHARDAPSRVITLYPVPDEASPAFIRDAEQAIAITREGAGQ